MADMEAPAIGIDLGTTYSCVGVFQHGRVEIIANDQGNTTTPSYVAFTDEEILVGDPAKAQATRNLGNTIFDAKRLIGRKFNDANVQTDMKYWPFEIVSEDNKPKIKVIVEDETKTLFPEEISSMVLLKMKETAEAYLGKPVTKAVITVPAYFNDAQRQATKDAATIAKLDVLRIINEPTAAALVYGLQKKNSSERNVMVFDLGGGTFDVSILNVADDFFEVISTAGDTHLGGEDFDNRMVNHFVEEFRREHNKDLTQNKKAIRRLKTACEGAKRTLSSIKLAFLSLDSLHEGIDFYTSITRARFEELNADLFRKTLEPVAKAIQDAGIEKSQIQDVVLVGASTRIPKVQKLLRAFFNGKELNASVNPDEAVAYGAAIQAAILNGDTSKTVQDLVLMDVTPLSLGIERVHNTCNMCVIVERNTTIPTKRTEICTTEIDYQSAVFCQVYEGEHPMTIGNNLLGSFVLENIPLAPRGVPQIEVTFNIDANGLLNVTAVEKETGNTNGITLTYNKSRLSAEEIERMVKDAEKYRQKFKKQKAVSASKNRLESYCVDLKRFVQDVKLKDIIDESDKKMLLKKCNEIIELLNYDNSVGVGEIEQKQKDLEDVFDAVISVITAHEKKDTYCEVLKIKKDATEEEIRDSFRQVARKYHSDKFKGDKDIGDMLFRLAFKARKFLSNLVKGKIVK